MRMQAQELLELGVEVGRDSTEPVYTVATALKRILRIARRLSTLDEALCNDMEQDEHERRTVPLETQLMDLLVELGVGFTCTRQLDPRGPSVYLMTPSRHRNSPSCEGIALY